MKKLEHIGGEVGLSLYSNIQLEQFKYVHVKTGGISDTAVWG